MYNNNRYSNNRYNNNRYNTPKKAKSGFRQTSKQGIYTGFRVVNRVLYTYLLVPPISVKSGAAKYYRNSQGLERILYRVKVTNTQTGQVTWSICYFYPEKKHFVSKALGLVFSLNPRRKSTVGIGGIFRITNK